jgi:ATP-dependent helicase/nuclease subunit A
MMERSDIPPATLAKQHQASNPSHSVWVSANAGSGKTHVLASRVIRLLLNGVAPSKILCLTFTKAAAANMAARVFDTLARWTQLSDEELAGQISATGPPAPERTELILARKLFARSVETPGGLKIQTIHAFCERLLHLFPFEANVPSRFEVPDELTQTELLQRALLDVFAQANLDIGALGTSFRRLTDECGQKTFEGLIKEAMRHSAIANGHLIEDPAEVLRRSLGVAENRDVAAIEHDMAFNGLTKERCSAIAMVLDSGKKSDRTRADQFRQALSDLQLAASHGPLDAFLESYLSIFLTVKGSAQDSLVTKGLAAAHPEIKAELSAEQIRLESLSVERKSAATLERTRALITIASAVFKRYAAEKAFRGILDFDDLVRKTLTLLERFGASWVHYKLDSGIDHILVDEAQDTSEAQWKILEELTSDFSPGHGRAATARTFFAVGDEKQSIFSFQGAAPQMFDVMRQKFEGRFKAGAKSFTRVPLTLSFRSVPGVLSAVDKVFEHGDHKSGLVAKNDVWMPHEALKHQLPGLVEIWPLVKACSSGDPRGWTLPLDFPDAQDPANIVAHRVAQKITQLIHPKSNEFVHEGQPLRPRRVRPGDILILVRSRGAFFEAMIRTLKKNQIPAAGADRLDLTNHIAVMDLIAAGRAALLPQDDLTLACVLKSPLIGLDDDDLLALAPGRSGSLFDGLNVSTLSGHAAAAAKLARWRARAGGGAFAFYTALLGADGGRRDIEACLGAEACDAMDEFLRLAIAHEDTNAPSLATFLNGLTGLEYSIKRDMETGAETVRVMTVHAAKGLEAKIVFVPDSCSAPSSRHDPKIFSIPTKVPGEEVVAWSPKKNLDCPEVAPARATAREAAREEYRRLLYVALTRAEERLYIAGFHGKNGPVSGCWANMIEAALGSDAGFEEVPAFWNSAESIRRFVLERSDAVDVAPSQNDEAAAAPFAPPAWLFRPAPIEQSAALSLTPSHTLAPAYGHAEQRLEAIWRGRAMHLLLQCLPAVMSEKRRSAALAFLSARASILDESARQTLAEEALALIAMPELADLFGPRSKAEVLVAGKASIEERSFDVAGQVDRIGESLNEILVADYKTGTPCPLDQTPKNYLTQMALYRAVLAPLWPKKSLRMALIWTAGPSTVWLPEKILDAALVSLAARRPLRLDSVGT